MRKILLVFLVLALLAAPVAAADVEGALSDSFGVPGLQEGLTAEEKTLLGDASPARSGSFRKELQELLSRALRQSDSALREAALLSGEILAISLLCGLGGALPGTPAAGSVRLAGLLGITAASISGVRSLLALSGETVQRMAVFSQLLLPCLGAAAVSSGAPASGAAICSLTVFFSDLLLRAVTDLLLPLTNLFLGLALADCALGGGMLRRFRELLSSLIRGGMKTIVYAFTAFLLLTQVVSGTTDALTAKAAKVALSGAVPVVGGILSDASETVLLSASLLKNSIGVYGMLAVLAICILPFLRIGVYYLVMKLTAAVSGLLAGEALSAMADAIGEALGFLLGMTGSCALLLLVSAACSMKAVGI